VDSFRGRARAGTRAHYARARYMGPAGGDAL